MPEVDPKPSDPAERLTALFRRAVLEAGRLARSLRDGEGGLAPDPRRADDAQRLVADLVELKADLAETLSRDADGGVWLDRVERVQTSATEEDALAEALDAIVAITGARRGFVVTVGEGEPEVRAARNLEAAPLGDLERRLSRSILADSLRTGEPVVVENALEHPRYGVSMGVSRLRLLSVLVAPFRIDDRVAGAVYVDHDGVEGMFQRDVLARMERFLALIARTLAGLRRLAELGRENRALRDRIHRPGGFEDVLTVSPAMTRVVEQAQRFAQSPWPVLVLGESGTGKELMARALHLAGRRRDKEFLALNMSAIPETLIEDTLFGHEVGAFADARKMRKGFFESVDGGTLFLDEIGDAPASVQVKLLRAVQFGEIQRLGSDKPITVDVRVIAATNRDLEQDVRDGRFRGDLLLRLNPLTLRLPPLRERPEDIALLVRHFLQRYEKEVGKKGVRITEGALARFQACPFAGTNVRQLENFIKYMLAIAEGEVLTESHLPPELDPRAGADPGASAAATPTGSAPTTFAELEETKRRMRDAADFAFIERVVAAAGGNVAQAAAASETDRSWFYARARQLGLDLRALRGGKDERP